MGDAGEAVEGGFAKTAVDEERVMVADERFKERRSVDVYSARGAFVGRKGEMVGTWDEWKSALRHTK